MTEKIAIHCPTEELWDRVIKRLIAKGHTWHSSTTDSYREDICVDLDGCTDNPLVIDKCDKDYYVRHGYTIIPAEEYLKEGQVVIGSMWRNRTSNRVHTITSVDERGWYLSDLGGNSPKSGYIKNFDYMGLTEQAPEFKVGDRVRLKSYGKYKGNWNGGINNLGDTIKIGDEGVMTSSCCAKFRSDLDKHKCEFHFDYNMLEECLEFLPTYSVPLRVRDKVRVVDGRGHAKGKIVTIDKSKGYNPYQVNFDSGGSACFEAQDLTLIPTEADITVGSVWEWKDSKGRIKEMKTCTVTGFDKELDPVFSWAGGRDSNWTTGGFLGNLKLIHRGDEVVEGYQCPTGKTIISCVELYDEALSDKQVEAIYIKTNKKEKKMKTRVISEGMEIKDTNCNNIGVVKYWDIETGSVAYKEADGTLTIGNIENFEVSPVQVIMPPLVKKPKPKVTKKGKKK